MESLPIPPLAPPKFPAPPVPRRPPEDTIEVRRAFLAWFERFVRQDVDGMMACVLPGEGTLAVGTGRDEVWRNAAALRQAEEHRLQQCTRVTVDDPEIFSIRVADSMAYVYFQAVHLYEIQGRGMPVLERRTTVLEKIDGAWVQTHTHRSHPDTSSGEDSSPTALIARRYRFLADELRDIVLFAWARDGRILETNRAAELAFGLSPRELSGLPVGELMTPESRERFYRWLGDSQAENALWETEHVRRDGGTFAAEASLKRVREFGEDLILLMLRDVTERRRLQDDLRWCATHDGLTEACTRTHFEAQLPRQVAQTSRRRLPLALTLFDMDQFRLFNNRAGCEAGHRALQDLAALLRRDAVPGDLLGRWDGDTMALLAVQDGTAAHGRGETLRGRFETLGIRQGTSLTVSFGVAALESGMTAEELLRRAEQALRSAKDKGRNRGERFEPSPPSPSA